MTESVTGPEALRWTHLEVAGMRNLRDVGGLPAADGQRVRRRRLLRSEALAHPVADAEHEVQATWDVAHAAALADLDLRTVVDLRTDAEVAAAASAWHDATGAEVVSLPIVEGGQGSDTYLMGELLDGTRRGISAQDMGDLYVGMLQRRAPVFGELVRLLAAPSDGALLVHCSAGKDRTGIAVALVLEVLGVPRQLIVDDYALTGVLRPGRVLHYVDLFAGVGLGPDDVRLLFESPPEAMALALEHLDTTYGGAAGYLRAEAGVTDAELDALRTRLLEQLDE